MNTIIIDDEKRARMLLSSMLPTECPFVQIVGEAGDLPEGIKLIHELKPDLVLLDIEMPGYSGLEIINFFNPDELFFQIIITTAYSDFAIKAFKLNALDYLLKPIEASALKAAVERAYKKSNTAFSDLLIETNAKTLLHDNKRISIPDSSGFEMVNLDELILLDADGAYTHLHLTDKRKMTATKKLRYFEEKLQSNLDFMRIHRGHIINLNHVKKFSRSNGGYVLLSNGTMVSVSREQIDPFIKRLG